ncbi:hypothetical protein PVAND_006741 [Polypedilum vanderplanki]|uniref:Uncharacterized protein n=1 Tax=Polypedilum vanderplanki TaxID=319348 RepID=A0A9J6C549_POLVA|nr:hypothetical protein PVAND_006741 [Polypedilum vanderplanki]
MLKIRIEIMTLTHLLFILLLFCIAHAAPPKIQLHNEDTFLDLSVVKNWKLICEDLCSLNLSGPACGLDCSTVIVSEHLKVQNHKIANLTQSDKDDFCETLCENRLGENECQCKISILAASSQSHATPAGLKPDRLKICSDVCRYQHVTLRSCPKCIYEEHRVNERFFIPFEPTNQILPPPSKHQVPLIFSPPSKSSSSSSSDSKERLSFKPTVFRPNAQQAFFSTTTDSTTPDWNRLCLQLCRTGTGGILCNCDLPPF